MHELLYEFHSSHDADRHEAFSKTEVDDHMNRRYPLRGPLAALYVQSQHNTIRREKALQFSWHQPMVQQYVMKLKKLF